MTATEVKGIFFIALDIAEDADDHDFLSSPLSPVITTKFSWQNDHELEYDILNKWDHYQYQLHRYEHRLW